MERNFALTVNGEPRQVTAEPETPLLYVLRNDLGLKAAKYGCGLEQCGACTVAIDGAMARSCSVAIEDAAGKGVETLEGIGTREQPHSLQNAFLAEQALQCGYCTSGLIMAAKVLLDANPDPSDDDIKTALQDNLCRCGVYPRIIRAVKRAAREMTR